MPGMVERTKVTVERTTTDIEVKANILEEQIFKRNAKGTTDHRH